MLGKKAKNLIQARQMVEDVLKNGQAWEKFRQMVIAQGGDVKFIDEPDLLPKAKYIETFNVEKNGFVHWVDARKIGEAAVDLGAGRAKKGDPIDHSVGIVVLHKVGDYVIEGEPLFTIHANSEEKLQLAKQQVLNAHIIKEEECDPLPLFYEIVD
jgi:pyrimidine-nucleoside phosphorylase